MKAIPAQMLQVELVGRLGAAVLWILNATLRWRFHGLAETPNFFAETPRGAIFVFWHNRQLLMPFAYRLIGGKRGGIYSLISRHRDGRYIARAAEILGCPSVAGSSSRGGSSALKALARVLKSGRHVAITPDGPRGPIYEAKPGALQLARLAGAQVFPVAYAATRAWQLGSWDKMLIPKPFSKIHLLIGEALKFEREIPIEQQLVMLQDRLREVTQEAEKLRMEKQLGSSTAASKAAKSDLNPSQAPH